MRSARQGGTGTGDRSERVIRVSGSAIAVLAFLLTGVPMVIAATTDGTSRVVATDATARVMATVAAAPAPDATRAVSMTDAEGATSVPVLLIPGWLDTARDLAALRIRLLSAGWPTDYVKTLTFADPVGSNRDHAVELERAIDSLVVETGVDQVDIVAHSMGGLATRWYLRGTSDSKVRRVVFIASPHRGTLSAHLAWGGGRDDMMPESVFLDSLNAEPAVPADVRALTIRTPVDTHIVPGESATLPGVPDSLVCCPTHAGLLRDDTVFEIVLDFLETPS